MSAPTLCPICQSPIPADAPGLGCPRCLLAEGFESHVADRVPDINALTVAFPELEILEVIGSGGMGVVYRARQRTLDRLVALKVLPPDIADDPRFADRFAREARALARLSHPHIVGVHESGERNGLFYLVMEYVDGTNLRHAIRDGELTPQEALAIVPQICDALQYAHERGIVHRDVKPENILLGKDGRVRIADFGLAKLLERGSDEQTLTQVGQVMGTPHYMAPEQIEHPGDVDHRADIYALGVVFYEMLTGELPIGRFAPPSRKVEVDVRLDAVVLRALEKERDRRYQNVAEVSTEVNTIVTSEPPAASPGTSPRASVQPPSPPFPRAAEPRPRSWWRRKPGPREGHSRLALLAAVMTLALASVPVVGLVNFVLNGATDQLAAVAAALAIPVGAGLTIFWLINLVSIARIWHGRKRGRSYTWLAFFAPLIAGFCFLVSMPKLLTQEFQVLQEKIDREFNPQYHRRVAERDIRSLWERHARSSRGSPRSENKLQLLDPDRRKWIRDLPEEQFDEERRLNRLGGLFVPADELPIDLSDLQVSRIELSPDRDRAHVTVGRRSFQMRFPVVRVRSARYEGLWEWHFAIGDVLRESQ